ncbi:UDP:flavonoid glycosyltransferase YjiC (YdhE family) [Agromyces flavus]|uniref:UDP:flavonoid glycosyltransferase YjiC (YdhE family) n=2 Tax=Agromyces flavus TaxID=589382 RepID=A0ABT1KMH5_9MICO|nr:nucleotide disphospho-sugar-binding domain-containing protein [Agromyces flavus]MCP2367682.1 UDP:flavonoid glycosyltransferase YjiC (YdhE family) [Agromyces flavus]
MPSHMADVMIAVMPFAGHVAPLAAVAKAFLEDGHAVRVYTGSAYRDRFDATGADVVTWSRAPDFDEYDLPATFPTLRGRKGPMQALANVEHVFIRTAAAQGDDLLAAYQERPWDLIVADALSLGARFASEHTVTPWVTVSVVPLAIPTPELPPPGFAIRPAGGPLGHARDRLLHAILPIATRRLREAYDAQRAASRLGPSPQPFEHAFHSPELVCATGIPELEWPRSGWPVAVEFVGSLTPTGVVDAASPPWWDDVPADRPIVHVTQGTLNVHPDDLIRPAFTALGRQPVSIVAATGRAETPGLPFPSPPNAFVTGLIDYARLLPRTTAMITNGGWGGVLAALSHGVPLIVAGGDFDKPEIAARVAWAGAGIDLRTGTPKPRAILRAWRRLSSDPGYRERAEHLGRELRRHDGPREVVEHAMRLLDDRRSGSAR